MVDYAQRSPQAADPSLAILVLVEHCVIQGKVQFQFRSMVEIAPLLRGKAINITIVFRNNIIRNSTVYFPFLDKLSSSLVYESSATTASGISQNASSLVIEGNHFINDNVAINPSMTLPTISSGMGIGVSNIIGVLIGKIDNWGLLTIRNNTFNMLCVDESVDFAIVFWTDAFRVEGKHAEVVVENNEFDLEEVAAIRVLGDCYLRNFGTLQLTTNTIRSRSSHGFTGGKFVISLQSISTTVLGGGLLVISHNDIHHEFTASQPMTSRTFYTGVVFHRVVVHDAHSSFRIDNNNVNMSTPGATATRGMYFDHFDVDGNGRVTVDRNSITAVGESGIAGILAAYERVGTEQSKVQSGGLISFSENHITVISLQHGHDVPGWCWNRNDVLLQCHYPSGPERYT